MSKRSHSIGLKLFIFFLVAMILFSAIGVMVIYLNVPTPTTTTPVSLPSDVPTTITLPNAEDTPQAGVEVNNNVPDGVEQPSPALDQEVPTEPAPTEQAPTNDVVEPTPNTQPTEAAPVEPTRPAQG